MFCISSLSFCWLWRLNKMQSNYKSIKIHELQIALYSKSKQSIFYYDLYMVILALFYQFKKNSVLKQRYKIYHNLCRKHLFSCTPTGMRCVWLPQYFIQWHVQEFYLFVKKNLVLYTISCPVFYPFQFNIFVQSTIFSSWFFNICNSFFRFVIFAFISSDLKKT